jgi:FKBP-type peptidyl-prolyl cis-trans isomerase FklB
MDKVSYSLGLGIGRQLSDMGADSLNIDDFAMAIKDVMAHRELQISDAEAQALVQDFFRKNEEKNRLRLLKRDFRLKLWG